MTREELIKKVAMKMDEISSSDDVIVPVSTGDNNPLYTQINYLLNESVNDVLMKAPIYRLQSQMASLSSSGAIGEEPADVEILPIFNGARRIAIIYTPDDFLRLVSISDNAFQRPIIELAIEGDFMDKRQHNKFLVAKSAKPVAVMGSNENGRCITCYSYESSESPNPTLRYVKRYMKDMNISEESDLDGYLVDIVSWVCAGKVFATQGDINKGKICDENAMALMI